MNTVRIHHFLSLLLLSALTCGAAGRCMAIERPQYSVELREPPYEIRRYAPTIVAEVQVDGSRDAAVSAGFRILAHYIFGGNHAKTSISMTAPVMQSGGQTLPMTAPVEQQAAAGAWKVRFIMPATSSLATLPIPDDARIHLLETPRLRVAVITFSGFWSDSNLRTHATQLQQWLKAKGLTATSAPAYAYYDPPWIPWFMRTIEVMVDLLDTPAQPVSAG